MRDMAKIVVVSKKGKMFEKDRICYVSFEENAYECIVPNTVNTGDKMVFIEADSILPVEEKWEFLRKRCYREDLQGFLIKCMTMGKKANEDGTDSGERVKSWGLCVTLAEAGLPENLKAGTDVTDKLNIRKYEPEEDASPKKMPKIPRIIKFFLKHKLTRWLGNMYMDARRKKYTKGSFPTDIIAKSDETTIQNCKSVIQQFNGKKCFITAKIEGASATYSLDLNNKNKPRLYVCSRNNRYDTPCETAATYYEYAIKTNLENKLIKFYKKTGKNIILQGELVSNKIQGNIYDFNESHFFVYRMKLLENGKWIEYNYEQMTPIIIELDLERVPLLEVVEDMGKFDTVDKLVNYAEGIYYKPYPDGTTDFHYVPKQGEHLWKDYLMSEGIVIKSEDYDKEKGKGFSFKVKNLPYQEKKLSDMSAISRKLRGN